MSCFSGKMREYRNISLDRFDGLNLRSTAYFLSHCHCDHMQGLAYPEFTERLSSRNDIFLYCSEVTKILLMEKHPKLEKFVRTLPVAEPTVIPIPEPDKAKKDKVTVTLIHASHCPGSVMFLFEGFDGTVLYTGDFRWESDQVMKIQALHVDQRVKPLVSLYVDTTFCHPNSFSIPSRQTIISAACDLVKEWTAKGNNYVVHFTPRANYGHEPLLKEVAQALGCKVHVRKDKEDVYNQMSELRGIFTSDSAATCIHACGGRVYGEVPCLPCDKKNKNLKVMVILPSTMFFTQSFRLSEDEIVLRDKGKYRICYSFHSSMLEVRDLVTYLQPRRVFPNVKPAEDASLAEVQRRLNEFLKLKHSSHVREELESQRPLGLLRQSIKRKRHRVSVASSDSEELLFGSQISFSPKKQKFFTESPAKNRITERMEDEEEYQSSYEGSCHSDSEMSGICESDEENQKENSQTLSTPRQSLLDAINSQINSQSESLSHRIVLYDDCEQTEGKALSLEEVNQQHQDDEEENNEDESDQDTNRKSDTCTSQESEAVNGAKEGTDLTKLNDKEQENLKEDGSASTGEESHSTSSSQESRISIDDTGVRGTENEEDNDKSNCHQNKTQYSSKNGESLDDVEALFEVEDSDDDIEVVEVSTSVQKTGTSLPDVPGRSTSLQEESDSDATLPPSQNSYTESPLKDRKYVAENCVEILETETESNHYRGNQTPRKLYQPSIDFYISPSKDSPEKCSPSIVKRRKKSNGWLNASNRKLVYVSDEEECSGNDKVVDLTLSSDEDS
ncbi:protein artemis-like isoform X2 [Saccostrea cucullata]|uniref:protein artemis-like isoform X2 n=1 Tax=Saccostrea cuccullata TaxID=36930 RepID=UPI002ED6608D